MKKTVLSIALAFACTLPLFAQVSGIGIRPSLTLSRYKLVDDYDDVYDAVYRPGAGLAAFLEINLGNRFTLQPEVQYVMRGSNLNSESTIEWNGAEFGYPFNHTVIDYRRKETLHYLEIPLMFEKNFGGGQFGGYVAAGPSLAFAIANGKQIEEITVEYAAEEGQNNTRTDRNEFPIEMGKGRYDTYKGMDLGLNAGAGLLYIMDGGELGLDIRYTHGLRNLDTDGLRNRGFSIGISYMYYLGQ